MIIKCPNCNAALVYDTISGKMKCEHCNTYHEPEEVEKQTEREFQVFCCTSCGARVSLTEVECAKYCAFCGQPTIVFERVSRGKRPNGIIPFSVTKQEAVQALRKRLSKGFYIPKAMKNFEVDRVVGMYLPFWVFDVVHHDEQDIRAKVGKNSYRTYHRNATAKFNFVPADAATNFEDEMALRLWPYDWSKMVPFEEGYLSGFCADCFDQRIQDVQSGVMERCRKLFDRESENRVRGSNTQIIKSNPQSDIRNPRYVMLPAWCLTFRYKGVPYTMLVNGQTKAVVGAAPFVKSKAVLTYLITLIPSLLVALPLCRGLYEDIDFFAGIYLSVFVFGFALLAFSIGASFLDTLKKHIQHATSKNTLSYAMRK